MKLVYTNCHGAPDGALLATDEPTVAGATAARVIVPDAGFDPLRAQALNERVWALGFEWARVGGEDLSVVDGISSADLAGIEATLTVLLPAVRGVLEAEEILRHARPERLVTAVAKTADAGYTRVESVLCTAVATTLQARLGELQHEHQVVQDERNAALVAKYAASRNPPSATVEDRGAQLKLSAAAAAVNAAARLRSPRRGASALVVEYNPTAVVARRWYALAPQGAPALIRNRFTPADLRPMVRHGERAFVLPPAKPGDGAARVKRVLEALVHDPSPLGDRFVVEGVDLTPIVLPELAAIATAYARWAEGRAQATRKALRRGRVRAVLVPYDGAPSVRLLVRAAQAERIPTAVLNDGWKGDDHQPEGMTADHAFALSTSVRDRYFSRRHAPEDVRVTGDPRNDLVPAMPPRVAGAAGDVLVGSFTFSPSDLNCRRGDAENFLDEVLEGIAASRFADRHVTVKLHPADRTDHYAPLLARHRGLDVELVTTGDVVDRIPGAAVYVTTYSTSLLHAALAGAPFVYYRVNQQRFHPPFSDDPVMDRRTAASVTELTGRLDEIAADGGPEPVSPDWVERFVGPRDGGNARRVIDALLAL